MYPLTLFYTKLSSLSNDRSVYLNLFDHLRFLAGKDEDFCLRKIERIIYVLIVITLNIHKKESICYEYIVFIFVNTANLLRMKTKINNVHVVELSSVGKIDTRRFLFNRTVVVGSFSMCYWSTFLLNDSK